MRKQLLLLALITISCTATYSQIIYESGYFIDESNQRTECLIRNVDWKNNPLQFDYKLSQNEIVQKGTLQNVKEFGIYNSSKYIRAKINIDRSSDKLDELGYERNPEFKEELLFLKVLIEGQASLYHYQEGDMSRFFYRKESEIQQLVYKKYLSSNNILENDSFRQELLLKLRCETIVTKDVEDLKYAKHDLEKFFRKYNECKGSDYSDFKPKKKGDWFHLTLRPGLNFNNLEMQSSASGVKNTDFRKAGGRFGVEAEFLLPYNKNKWGIILEPAYKFFKSEQTRESGTVPGGTLVSKIDYKAIELPVGVRHYFYLNDKSKLFVTLSYVFDISNNSTIQFFREDNSMINELEVKPGKNLALGMGYKYNNKFSLEIQLYTNRDILNNYVYWESAYRTSSIILGYTLF